MYPLLTPTKTAERSHGRTVRCLRIYAKINCMVAIELENTPINLHHWVNAALAGEEIVMTQLGKPIIKWIVVDAEKEPQPTYRRPGSAQHLNIVMADDFDEPLDDFALYMPDDIA